MAPTELEANYDLDVTIFLVEKLIPEDPAESASKKRRRKSRNAQRATLGQVKVKARRLRSCSTYFNTCMSERWAQSQVPEEVKFHLEVHTEVRYYEDCFSRMIYLYKPIASVACCIELLKVASQIGFQALLDIGVKCLGGTAWSDEEEKLVAEFCNSAHLVPFDSLTDLLRARFQQLSFTKEKQQERLSSNVKDLFSRYLLNALPEKSLSGEAALQRQNSSRRRFAMTLHIVMSGVESGDVCDEVLEHIQAVLRKALIALLTRVQRELTDFQGRTFGGLEGVLSDMCWVFELARKANATQALVLELLGKDLDDTARRLHSASLIDHRPLKVSQLKKWAAITYALFQDVLEGKLFLNSFQRSTLFWRWGWVLLLDKVLGLDEKHVKAVRVRIITTLPQAEQVKFWMNTDIEPEQGILWEAHMMWISRLVTRKAQPQSTASSNEVGSKTQD